MPKDLKSRVADNWRVLIAIADTFGPAWARMVREAATTFAHAYHDEDAGVILLSDLRDIFNRTAADRMASVELIMALLDIEESGWSEYRGVRDDQTPAQIEPGGDGATATAVRHQATPDLAPSEAAQGHQQAQLLPQPVRAGVGTLLRRKTSHRHKPQCGLYW